MKKLTLFIKALFKRLFFMVIGGAQTTGLLIAEIVQALFMKIAWPVVLERFLTRVLVGVLKWLRDLSTNKIVQETLDDVLKSLREKGLKEAKA